MIINIVARLRTIEQVEVQILFAIFISSLAIFDENVRLLIDDFCIRSIENGR